MDEFSYEEPVREYPLLFRHKDGRQEHYSQRTLRDPEKGIGLSLALECSEGGNRLNDSEEYGLFCTCTSPPVKMTLYLQSSKRPGEYHIGMVAHHREEAKRHKKDCLLYREDGEPSERAKHVDPSTGLIVYRLEFGEKKKAPAADKDSAQSYDPAPVGLKRRPAKPYMPVEAYFRENAILAFSDWNRYEREKRDFRSFLYGFLMNKTMVMNGVTLSDALKKGKDFRRLIV